MPQALILHVEDDSDDAFFVAHAFGTALPGCAIRHVKDGREAIDYLQGAGEFSHAGTRPKVDLILLDLKLPDVDGFEVLHWIRSQTEFKDLQVIILSGSSIAEDKERARQLGANAYFVKTPKYADVVAFIRELLQNRTTKPRSDAEGAAPHGS